LGRTTAFILLDRCTLIS